MRSKLFFLTICISSAIYSLGQNNDGVLFMLDKKIKGPVKIYYERKGDDNPKMITLSGYRYFTVDLNDSIFFELHNEEGTYEFVIYHDDVQITDSFLLDIKKNHFEKLFLAIKNFEIKSGDTINRFDDKWRRQGRWVEYGSREGFYKDDLKHGYWIRKYGNIILNEGWYQMGKEQGIWINRFFNGNINVITTYEKGKMHGPYSVFDENGRIGFQAVFRNNLLWEVVASWDSTGKERQIGILKNGTGKLLHRDRRDSIIGETRYRDGLKHGLSWNYFAGKYREEVYKNGTVVLTSYFFADNKTKRDVYEMYNRRTHGRFWSYYKTGKLKSIELYNMDMLYYGTYYYENGNKKEMGPYKTRPAEHSMHIPYKEGEWKEYGADGKITSVVLYKNDKIVRKTESK